jgi:hypothetical protein
MGNSFKQWHKLVLVACVLLVAITGTALAQPPEPDGYYTQALYVLNEYMADSDGFLTAVGFFTDENQPNLAYEISIHRQFDVTNYVGTLGDNAVAWTDGILEGAGYHAVNITPVALTENEPYYIVLGLAGVGSPLFGAYHHTEPAGGWWTLDTQYTFPQSGGQWDEAWYGAFDLRWAIDPTTTSELQANIWVEQTRGNWDVSPEAGTYVPPATLDAQITATDLGPFDIQIGVTGEMDTSTAPGLELIYINGTLENASGMDWSGLGVQLGYGLEADFVLATDGLALTDGVGGFFTEVFFDDLIENGAIDSELFPIVLPPGRDDPFFFTMRVYAIPEPGSLLLLGLASLALLAFGRPRR